MSAPNVTGIWVDGVGSTFDSHNNIIRAFSDIPGATVRGAAVTNGGTISSDNDDIAATVLATQTPDAQGKPTRVSILSLDGGGVRGLSSLLILRKVMAQLRLKLGLDDDAQIRPCDFFDLICGTSTGGLIALMLGRLRMTVDECIDTYIRLSMDIFGKRTSFATLKRLSGGAQYSARLLEEKVKDIVKSKTGDADAKIKDPLGNKCCRTFVAAIARDYADAPPLKFRTYSTTEFPADSCTIWQAARATSAATTFFDPVTFGTPNITYIDGALGGHNNPVKLAIDESKDIWPDCHFRCVISIGTGKPDITSVSGNLASIAKACIKLTTSCAVVDDEVHKEFARRGAPNPYFRFSVDRGLGSILLDEAEKQQEMAAITEAYMRFNAQAEQVKLCVQLLSEQRTVAVED